MPFRIEIKSKRGLTAPDIANFETLVKEYYPGAVISEKANRRFVATFTDETNTLDKLDELKTSRLVHSASAKIEFKIGDIAKAIPIIYLRDVNS